MHMAAVLSVLFHTVWNFLTILKITCKEENLFPFYSWQRRTRPAYRHRWEDHCGPLFLVQWVHWCYPPRRSQFRPVSGVHNRREAMHEPQGGYKKNFFSGVCPIFRTAVTSLKIHPHNLNFLLSQLQTFIYRCFLGTCTQSILLFSVIELFTVLPPKLLGVLLGSG